jgi:hypothetical protein
VYLALAMLAVAVIASSGRGAEGPAVQGTWIHEWGTFLSVQGSDGATLGGMVDPEENLPRFVRERAGRLSRSGLTLRPSDCPGV